MNLVVITCAAYSDAWPAFFGLLEKFWPDHPSVTLLTDDFPKKLAEKLAFPSVLRSSFSGHAVGKGSSWYDVLRVHVDEATEPFILMQEDFLLSGPVDDTKIKAAAATMAESKAGCFRVYPCPGPQDGRSGLIERGERYRISCQAAMWSPQYLRQLLRAIPTARTAADFELMGTPASEFIAGPVLSWGREDKPWPMEYLCSGISRGKWNPDAKKLCDAHGIEVDWSRRGFATA